MKEIKSYYEFNQDQRLSSRLRMYIRNMSIATFSLKRNIASTNNWIKLPYYHHVFDDEKSHFERQLKYLKNFGDFISMDDVCKLVNDEAPISGRYFCLSFDDGFHNCYTNMMEITSNLEIPVIIYLPTNFIGLNASNPNDIEKINQFYPENAKLISFLSWENCLEMLNNNITFGSHTCSHANLSKISITDIENELSLSKQIIQEKLNINCNHFACPWGRENIDFDPKITTEIAKKIGYKSFATTNRGKTQKGDNLFVLRRDHLIAGWENFQLKYFFGK